MGYKIMVSKGNKDDISSTNYDSNNAIEEFAMLIDKYFNFEDIQDKKELSNEEKFECYKEKFHQLSAISENFSKKTHMCFTLFRDVRNTKENINNEDNQNDHDISYDENSDIEEKDDKIKSNLNNSDNNNDSDDDSNVESNDDSEDNNI